MHVGQIKVFVGHFPTPKKSVGHLQTQAFSTSIQPYVSYKVRLPV